MADPRCLLLYRRLFLLRPPARPRTPPPLGLVVRRSEGKRFDSRAMRMRQDVRGSP